MDAEQLSTFETQLRKLTEAGKTKKQQLRNRINRAIEMYYTIYGENGNLWIPSQE